MFNGQSSKSQLGLFGWGGEGTDLYNIILMIVQICSDDAQNAILYEGFKTIGRCFKALRFLVQAR